MLAASDTDFLCELQQAFGYRLGKLIKVGQRFSFPLVFSTFTLTLTVRVLSFRRGSIKAILPLNVCPEYASV